ncbi:MAG: O-antigen ligase family protein [Anaerolineae bacterium]|nr:O-antigen ligase family protein [Anaerolineae bacterium]
MRTTLKRFFRHEAHPYLLPFLLGMGGVVWGLLVARLSPLNILLLITLTVTVIGGLLEPLIGVGIALALGPLWAWLRAELPQMPPLIGQYIFLLTVAAWLTRGILRRSIRIPVPPLLLPLLGFMLVALISLWNPASAGDGLFEWFKWGQILIMFLMVSDRLTQAGDTETQKRRRVITAVAILAGIGAGQALLGLWQFALRGTGPEHFAINERFYRAYGTFEQPNPYAGFLGMMGAIVAGIAANAIWEWLAGGKPWMGFLRIPQPSKEATPAWPPAYLWSVLPVAAVIAAALIASWSRGAWMGFGAAILAMIAILPRRGIWGVLLVTALIGSGLFLYAQGWLPSAIAERLTGFLEYTRFEDVRGAGINDLNFAVLERMAHWQAALAMWRDNFWFGVGFGCYEAAYPVFRLINWPYALGHAHNYYLNLLAETGIVGLSAYLIFFGSIFARLWQASRHTSGWMRGLVLGLAGAWMHLAVHDLVDNILVNNVHLHMGVMLALTAWVFEESKNEIPDRGKPTGYIREVAASSS